MANTKKHLLVELKIPDGVEVKVEGNTLKIIGAKGELSRDITNPNLKVEVKDGHLLLDGAKNTKREKTLIGTFEAHITNKFKGVSKGHLYKLKICSGHFPMNVSVSGNQFQVKNFLGEKVPRITRIMDGVTVKIDGEIVTVEGISKEHVAQTAANIEQLTRISDRDIRRFQDGIYIIDKDGKEI